MKKKILNLLKIFEKLILDNEPTVGAIQQRKRMSIDHSCNTRAQRCKVRQAIIDENKYCTGSPLFRVVDVHLKKVTTHKVIA